jgi:hypothetical protein
LVVAFLIGCVVLLGVGCAATRSETSNKKEQGRSPEATESEEEARCQGTMTYHSYTIFYRKGGMVDKTGSEEDMKKAAKKARHLAKREDLGAVKVKVWGGFTTNDLPGCSKGGLLLGTDKKDELSGEKGDDEIRGLGGNDGLSGGPGSDILYGGEGEDFLDHGDYRDEGDSEDVFYGGDGNDQLNAEGGPRAKLYCGEGRDDYAADKDDYVDSSCEKKVGFGGGA